MKNRPFKKILELNIEKTYIDCFRIGIGLPNYEFTKNENFIQIHTGVDVAFLNGVLLAQASEEIYQEQVPKILNTFRKNKIPAQWRFGPSTKNPEALEKLLLNHGAKKESLHTIMCFPLLNHDFSLTNYSSLHLKRVYNENDFKKWFQPFYQAFQLDDKLANYFQTLFTHVGFHKETIFPCYYLEENGKTLGCFSLYRAEGKTCGIFNIAVANDFRGKGFGKIISNLAAQKAKSLGYEYVGQYASREGKRVYEKLGAISLNSYPFFKL